MLVVVKSLWPLWPLVQFWAAHAFAAALMRAARCDTPRWL